MPIIVPDTKLLTPRWHPATLSADQYGYVNSKHRFNVVVAGRRSFKTEGAKRRVTREAITFNKWPDGRFFACGPTWQQAKDIFWEDIKALVPAWAIMGGPKNGISESELVISLVNGARIKVAGLDKPARIEGKDWDGGVITEYGNCKKDVLDSHITPMLTRGGWIDIEGVPEGRNHYYQLVQDIRDGKRNGMLHEWTTEEVLHLWLGREAADAELAEAKRNIDKRLYQQEYLARFVSFEGLAYYAWEDQLNTNENAVYDPSLTMILCFDFNRSPGVCAIVQELPAGALKLAKPSDRTNTITSAVGEIYIPRNSNTRKVCTEILKRWGNHKMEVYLHGDASGGNKTASSVDGSDWDLIEAQLKPVFGNRLRPRYPKGNPDVRARINAVNERLTTASGHVGMVVNPKACPNIVRDFEGVEADDAGDIVKKPGDPLTHISDAIGYYIADQYPARFGNVLIRH